MSTNDGSDLVVDIEKLALSNNFYDWFVTTNKLIDAVNPLNIYDITPGKGLTETRAGGNVILNIDSGKGIKSYPNSGIGKVTLDFESLSEIPTLLNDDLFVVENPGTGDSNNLYKILATNMLPPTLTGNHAFTGTITVSALNINDNVIRLQYGDATTDNDSGLILDTTSSSKVKFTYDSSIQAWFSNRNVGLNSGYSFVTNSLERRGTFKYGTYGSNQVDTGLELMMGLNSTQGDDKSWIIEARNVSNSLEFIYKSYLNTDTETTVFYAAIDTTNPLTSTFGIKDKIYITNVSDSLNFKNDPSVTTFGRSAYQANIIPISNSNGILDSKWTNRYVTTQHSGIAVGNIVKIYDDTNNQATVVKCSLTSSSGEEEAYSLGIVERISGSTAYVVTHGSFSGLTGLNPGAVYYLTSGSPNYTLTKPTTGIVKPVFVATSTTGGILFPMSSQGLSFGKVGVVSAAGGTVITTTGTSVTSDAPNDTLTLDAGSGISLETDTSNNKIIIRASTAGNQPTYSSIATNSGTVNAFRPSETLSLIGSGGIVVSATDIASTNGDQITVKGKYFRTISWGGESSTNDIPGSYTAASYDDTFNIYAGVGIGISAHPSGNGFRIDATGSAISSVAVNSQDLNIFKVAAGDSVLGYFGGSTASSVTTKSPSTNSILSSRLSDNRIEWQSPRTFILEKLADSASQHSKFAISTSQASQTSNRYFGIAVFDRNTSSIGNLTNHCFPAFTFNTSNNINGAVLGLQSGTGIRLQTKMSTSSAISNIPIIQINNDYPMGIGKIFIQDTGETITIPGTQTEFVNMLPSSTNMARDVGSGNCMWVAFSPTLQSSAINVTKATNIPGRSPNSSVTFSTNGITNTNGMKIDFIDNFTGNNGVFSNLIKDVNGEIYYTEELKGKTITFSVWVVSGTGSNQQFRLSYYPGIMAGFGSTSSTFSSVQTATSTPQRFTFIVNVDSFTNTTASANSNPVPPNLAIGNDGSTSAVGQSIIVWGAQAEFGSISSSNIKLLETQNFGTRSLVTNNAINFTTLSSPIVIDGDTNSSTVQFNIASNSITNNYLATMADNTVKVGTGSTNSDNTPQDLAIGTNSVLGRVGNGDLRSVNMTQLATMLGSTQFQVVQTDDGGTLLPSESTTIRLRGGSGITTSTGTNNEIIITSTGAPGGGSIGQVGSWNGSSSPSSQTGTFTKLLFQNSSDSDINSFLTHSISINAAGDGAIINSKINWGGISGQTSNGGPGLLFANGSENADASSMILQFSQVGNGANKDCLPFLRVFAGGGLGSLQYLRNATGGAETIQRVIGFKADGTLVATTATGITSITFDSTKITGLSATAGQITAGNLVTFPSMSSATGFYFGESNNLGLYMDDEGSNGISNFILATADSPTWSGTANDYVASLIIGARNLSTTNGGSFIVGKATDVPTTTAIKARVFGTSSQWANLSVSSGYSPRLCMSDFLIGDGPTSSSSSLSVGTLLRNDTTNNSLTFTNYNFTATGTTRTITKDRSTRIGLEVLQVSSGSTQTAYGSTENTAYITHSVVPSGSTTVDQFTLIANQKKSYKYLIHAEDASGDFYTTELVVQAKAGPSSVVTNIVQYGSTTTNSSTLQTVIFSLDTSGLAVTLKSNSTLLKYKVLKYEI